MSSALLAGKHALTAVGAKQRVAVDMSAPAVLDARAQHPTSTLAYLYNRLTIPTPLPKTHQQLDRAVDLCYRAEPFLNDRPPGRRPFPEAQAAKSRGDTVHRRTSNMALTMRALSLPSSGYTA